MFTNLPAAPTVNLQLKLFSKYVDNMGPSVPETFMDVERTLHQVPNCSGGNH